MILEVYHQLPTLNQYIQVERSNRFAAASLKKKHTNAISRIAKSSKLKLNPNQKHDISITWFCHNLKSDPDNISFGVKFILDGLVKSGLISNDGHKNIGSIHHDFELDKSKGYTYCLVVFN